VLLSNILFMFRFTMQKKNGGISRAKEMIPVTKRRERFTMMAMMMTTMTIL